MLNIIHGHGRVARVRAKSENRRGAVRVTIDPEGKRTIDIAGFRDVNRRMSMLKEGDPVVYNGWVKCARHETEDGHHDHRRYFSANYIFRDTDANRPPKSRIITIGMIPLEPKFGESADQADWATFWVVADIFTRSGEVQGHWHRVFIHRDAHSLRRDLAKGAFVHLSGEPRMNKDKLTGLWQPYVLAHPSEVWAIPKQNIPDPASQTLVRTQEAERQAEAELKEEAKNGSQE